MSRIGQKPVEIPEKTEVAVSESSVVVKGPLGELSLDYEPVVEIKVDGEAVVVSPKNEEISTRALWGTYSSLIRGMIDGVNKGFEKKLIVEGVGYRAELKGDTLVLNVGFSHLVEMKIPEQLQVSVEKENIIVKGIDKQKVGQFAAEVRAQKKPEPYKGKGIRYENEVVRRKEGKKTV